MTIPRNQFVKVLQRYESRAFAKELYEEAIRKKIDPIVLVGVHYRLFSEAEGEELPTNQVIEKVDNFLESKQELIRNKLSKKERRLRPSTNRHALSSEFANSLRYMAAQRDSMSD